MSTNPAPKWFMPVAVVALLWNLMGVFAFFAEVFKSDEAIAVLPEAEQALYNNFPTWATVAFFLAVFGGAIGSLGLVLKKKWAKPVLLVSLIGIVVQMFYSIFIAKSTEVYGPGSLVMPIMVILIGMGLVILSRRAVERGWII